MFPQPSAAGLSCALSQPGQPQHSACIAGALLALAGKRLALPLSSALTSLTPGPFALLRYKCKEEHTREPVFSLVKVSSLFRSQQPNSAGSCQDAPHPALLVYTGHAHCVTLSLLAPLPGTPFPDPSSAALKLKHHLQDEMLVSSPFPLSLSWQLLKNQVFIFI